MGGAIDNVELEACISSGELLYEESTVLPSLVVLRVCCGWGYQVVCV